MYKLPPVKRLDDQNNSHLLSNQFTSMHMGRHLDMSTNTGRLSALGDKNYKEYLENQKSVVLRQMLPKMFKFT